MPERTSCEAADDDLEARGVGCRARPVLAQAPEDVLDVDDRVVDQFADRDGEPAQRHRVDGQARRPGRRCTVDQDRDRDRRQRDRRGRATFSRKSEQDDRRPRPPPRAARVSTLSIEVSMKLACRNRTLVGRDAVGQRRGDLGAAPPRSRAVSATVSAPGCFWTETMTAGLALIAGIAALDPGGEVDVRDLVQEDRLAAALRDDDVARDPRGCCVRPTLRIRYSRPYWSMKPPPVLVPNCGERRLDLLERDVERAHAPRCRA